MSIASQQRVIEEKDATIRDLRGQLAQVRADARRLRHTPDAITALCDQFEKIGQHTVSIALVRATVRDATQ